MPESDSPVKRPGRKVARVLGSEGEEEEDEALTPSKGQVGPHQPAPHSWTKPSFPVAFGTECSPAARGAHAPGGGRFERSCPGADGRPGLHGSDCTCTPWPGAASGPRALATSPVTYSSREHLPLGVTVNRKGVSSPMDLRIMRDPELGLKNTSGLSCRQRAFCLFQRRWLPSFPCSKSPNGQPIGDLNSLCSLNCPLPHNRIYSQVPGTRRGHP